jgi:hypothetical protein
MIADGGTVGAALAGSVIDSLAAGGRRYEHGELVRVRLGADFEHLTLPDGSTVGTLGAPSGELLAAHRASGAPFVVAGSSAVPSTRAIRMMLPVVAALMSFQAIRGAARRRLAAVHAPPPAQLREASWAHARVEWPDGVRREGWLRAGEAMAFTTSVMAEVAARLARGEGRPGAYTPGSLFGPELAVKAGGQLMVDQGA